RFTQPDTIIPDPNNPQTLNRYAYVTNNPARYIDPSEHGQCQDVKDEDCSGRSKVDCDISPEYCPPDDPRFWELWHQANELLNLFASGDIDSLEVMARIVEAAAGIYGDDKNSFMKALGWIFIGTQELGFGTLRSAISNPNQCAGIGRAESDCPRDIIHLDDSGFHEDFQDEGQQLFHAWAYFAQLFSANPAAALEADAGNIWHEGVEGALGHDGASLQDYKLSVVAGKLGQMFYVGAVSMEDLGDEIRYWFGESGPGAWGMAFVGPGTILR
ncbi:MAG: hypothetical protein OEZ02_08185, partial [Anaerolineae bacterium]|nr:hypothetical protein [Anaerolineae bacterium]